MPCAPRIRILSKPAGCAGSACCCYFEERKLRPKVLTGWARQLVLVADGGFASLALLKSLSIRSVICVTRMRLDVRLFSPAPPRKKGTKGRPRLVSRDEPPLPIRWVLIRDPKGKFETPAILCAGLNQTPHQIVEWFLLRWQVEVTFHTLAWRHSDSGPWRDAENCPSGKRRATFSDAIALVREHLWLRSSYFISRSIRHRKKIRRALPDGLMQTACYAE